MKKYLCILILCSTVGVHGQPLRDINYAYLYNPDELFAFNLKPVRGGSSFSVLYSLQVKDTAGLMSEYSIEWEGRALLSDKEGSALPLNDHTTARTPVGLQGMISIPRALAPQYVVAKVVKNSLKRAWIFFTSLEPNLPVSSFLWRNGTAVMEPFIHAEEKVTLASDSGQWIASYYDDDFPPAAPAFSEAQARVSRGMTIDSVFAISPGEVVFSKTGLYLIQRDTNALQGFAFRTEVDYPQYTRMVSLPGPLVYITTRQEYDKLISSLGNKRAFDRVILTITADTERARTLLRNYFRRVELANRYFTSYKEGWKTDRGMIYIIFGKPEEVFRFNDREVWNYKTQFNIRFTFSKSSSLFDPDNFVLIREKKYENTWYEVIDLWRNARF